MGQDEWIELRDGELPVAEIVPWVVRPECGAIDLFLGTVRNQTGDRGRVETLEYEAYEPFVLTRMADLAREARRRWPQIGRLAFLHRVGIVPVGEISVAIAASTPHRAEAFDVVRWSIDALKATVPIWKREIWDGGADWALGAHELSEIGDLAGSEG